MKGGREGGKKKDRYSRKEEKKKRRKGNKEGRKGGKCSTWPVDGGWMELKQYNNAMIPCQMQHVHCVQTLC